MQDSLCAGTIKVEVSLIFLHGDEDCVTQGFVGIPNKEKDIQYATENPPCRKCRQVECTVERRECLSDSKYRRHEGLIKERPQVCKQ